ncbi:MBL fold metallo-hydrolase [Deinococcus radiodurans]|jgi:Zn-dependent hydrolases, including glyoxylases|nr:MBL fold metallo-hydrolase [Deinococcus radiodurans]ANC70680.1 MBL fold metallo-hydrolase [Deinococcus radiodurans R1 = ATCC 13939 = DSM 20539]QIP27947.1 MBL fold metallo-hydrolase [Deinococcus radiodurans]QIP31172.1 MBL fold metallo-hydrolase [Deinococcus radiodurans]UID71226.1 MBL fold metallo-hydrolase [Deinococcus radiodurans R1 = ATCC 13939 = DSM 20539]UTA51583.1 MBL fold metallo-hydrolase [Deinococcus radiodurans]
MVLLPLAPGAFHLPGPVNSVVLDNGAGGALLIDTGLDDSHARKLLREVAALGLRPAAILNTHSHTDHHGGNAFILKRFPEVPVFAPPLEAAVIRFPVLEPLSLFGALPPREVQTKFLLAPSSPAQGVEPGEQRLGGVDVELLAVPGHAAQMYAVRVGDVLYAADALFGPDALAKHPLTFCVDSAAQKASAAALAGLSGVRLTLPAHGDPAEESAALVAVNLASYERTTAAVREALTAGAATVDELLARVCAALGVTMTNAGAVLLNRAVISAHLSEGLAAGWAQLEVSDHRLLFAQR